MSEESKSVEINILGRVYPISVNDESEKKDIREVEETIKYLIDQFKGSYAYKDDKDLLAMAVIQFASKAVFFEQESKNLSTNIKKKIDEIDRLFETV